MRTLTKLLLKEASSSATGAAAVASAASTSSRPRTPERRGSECDTAQHRTCSSSCSSSTSPSGGGRKGAGNSDISNNDDGRSGNGSLNKQNTKAQHSNERRQPRQWSNTVSFLIQNVLGVGSSAQRAKAGGNNKFDAACLSNPPSPVSTPRGSNLGHDDNRTSEQPEELMMGMACRARPILGPPLPLPDPTGSANSSRVASASARPFASTGSFSPANNTFLRSSSPPQSATNRPLPKAPTGAGGHVLYPEQPHSGKTREALLDIFGHAGENSGATNKHNNNSSEDDRILPSLVYGINWSLVRVVPLKSVEAAASSGLSSNKGTVGNISGVKGRRGGPSKKATVTRRANGEVVVNFPTTGGAAPPPRPPAASFAEGPAEGTTCEDLSFESLPRRGFYLPTDSITEYLFDRFVPSHFDSQTYRWVKGKAIPSVPRGAASAWLQAFMSRTSANALTGRGEMFVVSRSQVVALIKKYDEGLLAERKALARRKREAEAKGRRNDDHHQRMAINSKSGDKSSFSPSPSLLEPAEVATAAYYYNSLRIPLLVDIGAGDGGATVEYSKNLFGVVGATEDNKAMQWRLWWRGFKVLDFPSCIKDSKIFNRLLEGGVAAVKKAHHGAISNSSGITRMIKDASSVGSLPSTAPPTQEVPPPPPPSANVTTIIALMNVLDRADKPLSLLKGIVECMKQIDEGGEEEVALKGDQEDEGEENRVRGSDRRDPRALFMMAVVLPWCPFVETNTKKLPPSEPLPMDGGKCQERAHFETSLATLVERVLIPNGLEVVAWTRVPYLCEGSATHGYYRLDDAVLLMRRATTSTSTCTPNSSSSSCTK